MLHLGAGGLDAITPMVWMIYTVMAVPARMEPVVNGARITGSRAERQAVGKDLDTRERTALQTRRICTVAGLIEAEGAGHPGRRGPRHVPDHPVSPDPGVDHDGDLEE